MTAVPENHPGISGAIATLALARAYAASWDGDIRLLGNLRVSDLLRGIDAAMPLREGELAEHRGFATPSAVPDLPDDAPPGEVLVYLLACSTAWVRDAKLIGPVTAGALRDAVTAVLSRPEVPAPEADPCP